MAFLVCTNAGRAGAFEMVKVKPNGDSMCPFMMPARLVRLMVMKKRCFIKLKGGCFLWGAAFIYLFPFSATHVFAQGNVSQEQMISRAAEEVQKISDHILEGYVSKNIPLVALDIQEIGYDLKEIIRYQGAFNSEQRSHLYLVRAYLSHYSRESGDKVIEWAQKAYKFSPKNPDTVDSLIVLAMYHGRYDLAKGIMGKHKAGKAVMLAPDIPVAGFSMSMVSGGVGGDPNTAFSSGGRNPTAQARRSKWIPSRLREGDLGRGSGGDFLGQGRIDEESGGDSLDRSGGKLGLPLEYMPANMLGESFSSVHIRTVNGGSFRYAGGGQMLCAFLWSLPVAEQDATVQLGRSYLGSGFSSVESRSALLEVGKDLWTNANQYRELYRQHILSGKIAFMAANLDAPRRENISRINTILIDNSWPWANFMLGEGANRLQWPLREKFSQVMMLVDSEGTICYMGPVGGFLPMMLIESRLPKAVAIDRLQEPMEYSGMVRGSGPESSQIGGGKKGFLGRLFGGMSRLGEKSVVGISDSGAASGTPGRSGALELTIKDRSVGKGRTMSESVTPVSHPQAKQMLEAARVLKRLTPRAAIQTYDEILDRYSNSLEAEEAKLHIKSILRNYRFRDLKELREKQGEYTGS